MSRPRFILVLLVVMLIGSLPRMASAETVAGYCETFARTYAGDHALEYQERSASIERQSDVMMWLSNMFQPPDSRFTAGYTCAFRAGRQGEPAQELSVSIFLTNTRQFAEHTQWEYLQLIPIEYVVDEPRDRAGYGVFKYLERP